MSASPKNSSYAYTEIVKVTMEVEIAYNRPEGRADAVQAAASLLDGVECGGGGRNGCYNAVKLQAPTVEPYRAP